MGNGLQKHVSGSVTPIISRPKKYMAETVMIVVFICTMKIYVGILIGSEIIYTQKLIIPQFN